MADKLLCFRLNGYPLAVEPEQIEKILINKHPSRGSFVLETGVEVKSLSSYIPLPEKDQTDSGNIMFVKDQKDFYGFTVDRIVGYLKLTGTEKLQEKKFRSPIKYFVRNEGRLIPVLDLQYITNSDGGITFEDIEEIKNVSLGSDEQVSEGELDELFQEISEEDIFRSIEEEIRKRKDTQQFDNVIHSEKRGLVLPLVVNISIVLLVSLGFLYYFFVNRVNVREQMVGGKIAGVEEELIREIRRRSEAEVEEQRKMLEDARKRLETLQQEKDYFLQNQDKIFMEREKALNDEFQRKLEEARRRLEALGVTDIDAEMEKERARLYDEYLSSRNDVREEIDALKRQYEQELQSRESAIRQELGTYSKRINEVEQRLVEEQAKLKEAEQRVQNIEAGQQEYIAFRRQLNSTYNEALGYLQRKNYARGIDRLKNLLPIIENARRRGIGEQTELKVEEDLANSILYLAEQEQNRIDLDQIGQKTMEAAQALEREGKLREALSRYFTVYTVSGNDGYRTTALARAEGIMDRMYQNRSDAERARLEQEADQLFAAARAFKADGEYEEAMGSLQKIITDVSVKTRNKKTLDEIIEVNKLWSLREEKEEKERLNRQAAADFRNAEKSYRDGYFTEALAGMESVILNYGDSDYSDKALSEIMRINKEMRGAKIAPPRSFKEGETDSGVIIQALSGGNVLFNLGGDNNVKEGDVLQVFRKNGDQFAFVGSVRAMEVYPRLTKGKVVYSEEVIKIGDVVAF